MRLADDDGGSLILRHAAKMHRCDGDGRATEPEHSQACPGTITVGQEYLEVLWSAPAFQSGQHVCAACAVEFYSGWVA